MKLKNKANLKQKRVRSGIDWASFIRTLRADLAPGENKPLSQERFARLIGVSWVTVARWESGSRPDTPTAQKLKRLRKVLNELLDMVERDVIVQFLESRHSGLLNLRPVDLLSTEDGYERVMAVLESASSGTFG